MKKKEKKHYLKKSVQTVLSELNTVPAEYSTKCSILLRVEVFCCNNYGKMSDLKKGENRDKNKTQILDEKCCTLIVPCWSF